MYYDLCERVFFNLERNPNASLKELSPKLQVSVRTMQNAIFAVTGKKFGELRKEMLLKRVESLLTSAPNIAIKAVSFEAGYRSPRAFARAVRRACGISPKQLRSRIGGKRKDDS